MGGFADVGLWGVAGAMFAVAAAMWAVAAAIAFFRQVRSAELGEMDAGYNALAPTVELRASSDAETIFIQIRDRGHGIDPSRAEIAFERFWRGPYGDGDARPGVGLGLYLVRRLVERQMGWVSLRPRDGGGTVAEVRLLRADGPGRRPTPGEA